MGSIIKGLKFSNEFINTVLESITSAIFIVDKDVRVIEFNDAIRAIFQKKDEEIIRKYCGDALGCSFTVIEEKHCGDTSYCHQCTIRGAIVRALDKKEATIKKVISREFRIKDFFIKKHFQATVKPFDYNDSEYALIIFEDITDIEKSRQDIINKKNKIDDLNRKYKQKLDMARKVQKSIMPEHIPKRNNLNISFSYNPIDEIGGDFFDIKEISYSKTGFFICDVSGHGLPAALVTMTIKALIDTSTKLYDQPARLIEKINNRIINIFDDIYITLFYGVYDSEKLCMDFVRCGHPYPILINKNGYVYLKGTKNIILGIDKDIQIEKEVVNLDVGDKLLLYTDGLFDTDNRYGQSFEEKAGKIINSMANQTIESIIETISKEAMQYRIEAKRNDDICMLGFEITD
jgi:sigma-B regulation protein RsbU (phosphoserine phosphatase)